MATGRQCSLAEQTEQARSTRLLVSVPVGLANIEYFLNSVTNRTVKTTIVTLPNPYMGIDHRKDKSPWNLEWGTLMQIASQYKTEHSVAFKIRQNPFSAGPRWGAHDAPSDHLVGWGEDTPPHTPPPLGTDPPWMCPQSSSLSQAAQSRCTVVRPIQKSIGKWEIRPPVKS